MIGMNRVGNSGLYPQKNYIQTQRVASVPIQSENAPKTLSKKKKIGIALAIGTAAVGIGTLIATKGKALRQKQLLADIPADLQARFANLKNLNGKEFADKAYKEMVDYMGLSKVAPKNITFEGADGFMSVQGGYNPIKNTINYTEGCLTKLTKAQQINMFSHELKHCEQFTNMLRTEGLTVEKYVESQAKSTIKNILDDPMHFLVKVSYENAVKAGKGDEWIAKQVANLVEKRVPMIKENFKEVLSMPKIKADSPEGRKAFEQLKANENYEGLGFLGLGSETYKNHPLEVEAYGFGDKIEELFNKYMQAVG